MVSRRILMLALAAVMILATAGPAAAAKPTRTPPPGVTPPVINPPASPPVVTMPNGERPLTPAEQAISDAKVADALAYAAQTRTGGLVTLACVTPTSGTTSVQPMTAAVGSSLSPVGGVTTNACYVPSGFLSVEARQQEKDHYCGPAAGQVISNYAWAMSSGKNRYTQNAIAGWMKTNVNGLTNAPELAGGLQEATKGAPRTPANWHWGVTTLSDVDHDGTTGDELQDFVRAAISSWKMPLAIAVKPHDRNSSYHLSSWPREVASTGHWIAVYGWYSYWTGTDFARIYYADSSKNQGGGTGKYWDPTRDIAIMIGQHTKRIVW